MGQKGTEWQEIIVTIFDFAVIGCILFGMAHDDREWHPDKMEGESKEESHFKMFRFNIKELIKCCVAYLVFHVVWYVLDIHKRFGIWKKSEPWSHFVFSMKTLWIVALYAMGKYASERLLGLRVIDFGLEVTPRLTEEHLGSFSFLLAPENPTKIQTWTVAIIFFYICDFCRYWIKKPTKNL